MGVDRTAGELAGKAAGNVADLASESGTSATHAAGKAAGKAAATVSEGAVIIHDAGEAIRVASDNNDALRGALVVFGVALLVWGLAR